MSLMGQYMRFRQLSSNLYQQFNKINTISWMFFLCRYEDKREKLCKQVVNSVNKATSTITSVTVLTPSLPLSPLHPRSPSIQKKIIIFNTPTTPHLPATIPLHTTTASNKITSADSITDTKTNTTTVTHPLHQNY